MGPLSSSPYDEPAGTSSKVHGQLLVRRRPRAACAAGQALPAPPRLLHFKARDAGVAFFVPGSGS